MNRLIRIFTIAFFPCCCFASTLQIGQSLSSNYNLAQMMQNHHRQVIPDVMGYVNIVESTSETAKSHTIQVDDYTIYPGFPISVNGASFEGGIFCNMDADPEMEIVYNAGSTVQAWNLDTTPVPGWPQSLSYTAEGAPALGDIDDDGVPEIVTGSQYVSTQGAIYAFELNGTPVTGFPINHGYTTRTIVLADLDGDGAMEIITNKRLYPVGEYWVYQGDGSVYPGWPQSIGHVPASSAAVGDITGDGIPEIIGESYTGLYVWDTAGNLLPGFPFMMPNSAVNSYSSPVLADLDGDGLREIIFGTHVLSGGGFVFVLKNDGSQLPGWPKAVNWWIYGPPAVGYVDNDEILDVVVGDQVLSPQPTDYVYAWDATGHPLPGFPIGPINAINNQVALGDLDNDGMTELLFDDNTSAGIYLGYNHDGTPLAGFPLVTQGTTFFNMVCLTDVDNDGFLNIIGASDPTASSTNVYLWTSDVPYNPATIQIPMWQYNTFHDGVMPSEPQIPPDVEVTLTPSQPPVEISTVGGSFDFVFRVDYHETPSQNFDGWLMIQSPDSHWTGPVMDPLVLLPMSPGTYFELDTTYIVVAGLDTGTYRFEARIGNYPNQIWDSDFFTFLIYQDTLSVNPKETNECPTQFALLGNYPNPFNPVTTISFSIPIASHVNLSVFDITGRHVATLYNGWKNAGNQHITFSGSKLSSGIYFYRIQANEFNAVGKMILLK
jgi:hypothetical protein